MFLWREIAESCCTQSEQVKNGPFKRGCTRFQLFFIDFQLFVFPNQNHPWVYSVADSHYDIADNLI
jgi:hypothetical protein